VKTLTMALYAEGTTDDRFLPYIILRTIKALLIENGVTDVDVWEPTPLNKAQITGVSLQDRILSASRNVFGYHILFIHQDADDRSTQTCYQERIAPGLQLIESDPGQVCKTVVPIIPIRNIEAWLICDPDTLLRTIGTSLTSADLDLPASPQLVEKILDPKAKYKSVVTSALSSRRRGKVDPGIYYEKLGREINLSLLRRVPAYAEFVDLLRVALQKENFY
jgi:hypothetical protein